LTIEGIGESVKKNNNTLSPEYIGASQAEVCLKDFYETGHFEQAVLQERGPFMFSE
jgi:hypothetical protein